MPVNYVSKDKYKKLKQKFMGLKEVRKLDSHRASYGSICPNKYILNVNQTTVFYLQEYLKVLGNWEETNNEVRRLNAERR